MSILGRGFTYVRSIRTPDGRTVLLPDAHNIVPDEGVNFVANLILGSASPNASWYAFLYEGNYIPSESSSAADLPGVIGECTAYVAATRPIWTGSYDSGAKTLTNTTEVEFVMNQDKVLYGAGIVSSSTKAGTGGFILSIARFPSPEEVKAGAVFSLTADLPLLSTDL